MTPIARRRSRSVRPTISIAIIASLATAAGHGAFAQSTADANGGPPGATPTANARLVVPDQRDAEPAPASRRPEAGDPVADRVQSHGARSLGGSTGPAVGSALPPAGADVVGTPDTAATADESGGTRLPAFLGSDSGAGELLRVGASLGVVLAIAFILQRTMRRFGGAGRAGRPAGVLEILARYPVGRGQQLVVLRLDRRVLLVHQGGGRMEPITEVTDRDEVASLIGRLEAGASGGEAERFRRTLAEFETGRGPDTLRPDGTFAAEGLRETGRNAFGSGLATPRGDEPGGRASGLAAALRAGRRRVAYGAAARPTARPARTGVDGRDGRSPEIEIVDLTRPRIGGRS